MMASARAEPIWGRASSCSLEAVLMSIRPAWDGAVVVAAGLVAGVAGAGLEVDGLAGVFGAAVCARTGTLIRPERVASAARASEGMNLSNVLGRAAAP